MGDRRTDPGQYYPGGRVVARHDVAPPQIIVQWSDVQGKPQIAPLPDRYREDDMKGKINEIASKFATVVVAALIGWTAVADITVQKKRKDMIYNDEQVVVDVTVSGVGVDTNAVRDIVRDTLATNGIRSVDGAARPLPKYLHALDYDDTYPDAAEEFYRTAAALSGGCSIVRKGNLVGGNFDYPYDDACSFAIKVSAASNRHASVGMAYVGTNLTESVVCSGKFSPLYRVLPGMTESGINDAGVYAKINVIPRDPTKDPAPGGTRDLHALAVVRYVLDHFDNTADAAEYVAAHYYIPETSADSYHWVIADVNGTYVVEDGVAQYIGGAPYALTNHRVMTSDTYGNGYERRSVLATQSTVESALSAARFTNAYANGWPWPDEFAGQTDAQGRIPHDATDRLKAWADAHVAPLLDANRKPSVRGNGCWQTVHSAIYDFAEKTMKVAVQETDEWYVFALPSAGTDEAKVRELAGEVVAPVAAEKRDKTDLDVYELTVTGMVHEVENDTDGLLESFRAATPVYAKSLSAWGLSGFDNDTWSFETIRGQSEDAKVIRYRFTNDWTGDEQDGSITRFFSVVTNGDRIATARTSIPFEKNGEFYVLDGNSVVLKDGAGYKGIAALPDLDAKLSKSDVIDPASATTTGKAADALNVNQALAAKRGMTERVWLELQPKFLPITDPTQSYDLSSHYFERWAGGGFVLRDANGVNIAQFTEEGVFDGMHGAISTLYGGKNYMQWSALGTPVSLGTLALTSDIPAPYTPTATDPTFSNAVLSVGIDTNVLAAVAASTNAVAQIGEFYAAFSDIGLTPTQGGMTLAGLLAALVAAVTLIKKTLGKIADNSGKPTDEFATDLLAKPVAISAINDLIDAKAVTIVKLADGTETMAAIKARLDVINTAGKHVFFDTAAIEVTNPLYLCTVFIDADEGILRLQDQVTGKQYIGAYDGTETLAQVLSKAVDAYVSIQVSAATKDINPSTGTTYPVVGQTVYLHEGEDATGPVRETAAYDGAPVSFMVPKGFRYFVRMSNTLQDHFNPHTPVVGADKGVANANLSIAFEYDDLSTVDTFAGIQAALANFPVTEAGAESARTALVYKGEDVRVIADTWTDYDVTPPVSYDDPMVLLDVRVVEGEDGQSHLAAIMMRQYATKRSIQFDAPQYDSKCAAGETVDGSLTYYGWLDSSDGSADVYGETAPRAYTSSGLEVLHGGAAYKLKSNMTVAAGDPWDADKWTALADSANPGNTNALHVLSGLQTGQALPTNYREIFKSSINDSTRNVILYGYNRYENSGWRSYLTADPDDPKGADENGWWKKHAYGTQIAPSGATYSPYQKGCSAALLNAAKPIKVKCLANTVTDGGGSYEVCDKIWLPCIKDLFGTSNSDEARTPYEYWRRIIGPIGDPPAPAEPNNDLAAINGFRIFKNVTPKTGSAVYLRLRSSNAGYSGYVWYVAATGHLSTNNAGYAYAAVPACAIY